MMKIMINVVFFAAKLLLFFGLNKEWKRKILFYTVFFVCSEEKNYLCGEF